MLHIYKNADNFSVVQGEFRHHYNITVLLRHWNINILRSRVEFYHQDVNKLNENIDALWVSFERSGWQSTRQHAAALKLNWIIVYRFWSFTLMQELKSLDYVTRQQFREKMNGKTHDVCRQSFHVRCSFPYLWVSIKTEF